jgi:Family of unknown function (DUF6624)
MTRANGVAWLVVGGLLGVASAARGDDKPAAKAAPAVKEPALHDELLAMVKVDQEVRQQAIRQGPGKLDPKLVEHWRAIDRKNTARMKEVIDKHGWPGKALVGDDGSHATWLLVQHADEDKPFQRRCLELMKESVKKGEASGRELAYLTDRVLVGEGKKQLYGTQFRQADGTMEPSPIEDEANVDKRRAEVGLEPLAEYRKRLEELYRPKPPAKP